MTHIFILFTLIGTVICGEFDDTLKWGRSYNYEAILTVPGSDIEEPYQVWVDGKTGNTRVDYYNGLVKLFRHRLYGQNKTFQYFKVHPQEIDMFSNEQVCHILPVDDLVKMYSINTYLPIGDFVYQGADELNGEECQQWKSSHQAALLGFNVLFSYTIWAKRTGDVDIPLRYNFISTADNVLIDEYNHEYLKFNYTDVDNGIFEIPEGLTCKNFTNLHRHEPTDSLLEFINPEYGHLRVSKSFESFKTEHNKVYKNATDQFNRMVIFKDNIRFINYENRKNNTYTLGVNHLADLTSEEFAALMRTKVDPKDFDDSNSEDDIYELYKKENNITNEKNRLYFDWRDFNAVTVVKEQTSMCGSCYAFATAAAVESALYIQRGFRVMMAISEQAIIDCSWSLNGFGNDGCEGGFLKPSLDWIKQHGVPYKVDYGPYLAMEGYCHHSMVPRLAFINGYNHIARNVDLMKFALQKRGPLLVGVNTTPRTFQFYSGGIYTDRRCSSHLIDQNHAMVVVGYEFQPGLPYWSVKNSYGPGWGENGYMRIAIPYNICGVSNNVFSVVARVN